MFLRRVGQKILLLHSYRDGTGKVRQLRLADFAGAVEAVRQLRDKQWKRELKARYPDLEFNGDRLLERARGLRDKPSPKRVQQRRGSKILDALQGTVFALQRLLEQAGDVELKERVVQQLADTSTDGPQAELRSHLRITRPPRRATWHPNDPEAAGHRQALQSMVDHLRATGRLEEACAAQGELARAFPERQAWLDHGVLLQRLGRWDEAIQQYSRLPYRDSLRHYQIASAICARGDHEESLEHLLRALTWDREVAEGLVRLEKGFEPLKRAEYWRRFGELWTPAGRKFLLAVYNQSLVKMGLGRAARLRVKPRQLFRGHAISVILSQARDGVAYRKLQVRGPIIDF